MEQIKLDIVPAGVASVAHASQFDNGRQIRFNLFNQGTPYTLTGAETVTMVVNGEEENITNTSDNYVIWDVAEEDCEEVGVIGCEIRIVLGSMLIGSKNFFLEVEMDPYDGKNVHAETVGPADICTFETTLAEPLSVTVDVEATGGNGTPDSPNPIVGYTEANITRCGVNLWDEEYQTGYWDVTNGNHYNSASELCSKNLVRVAPNKSFYFYRGYSSNRGDILYYDVNGAYLHQKKEAAGNASFTTPANCYYIRFNIGGDYGNVYHNDVSINSDSTDTTYHAYTGDTYTVSFGQTVYGGQLDVTRGKLTVTSTIIDLGSMTWTYTSGRFLSTTIDQVVKRPSSNFVIADILCDSYEPDTASNTEDPLKDIIIGVSRYGVVAVRNSNYSDPDVFKTAMDGHYLVYPLATSIEIDLTPEVISAIVGTNNVFADCGQTTVEYLTAE